MSDKKVIITRMRAPIERVEVRFVKGGVYASNASMEIRPNEREPETWVASFLDWTATLNHGQLALIRGAFTEFLGESEVYATESEVAHDPGFGPADLPLKECLDCNTKSNGAASYCYHCGAQLPKVPRKV